MIKLSEDQKKELYCTIGKIVVKQLQLSEINHPTQEPKKKRKAPPVTSKKYCASCQGEFTPASNGQKYCPSCRDGKKKAALGF